VISQGQIADLAPLLEFLLPPGVMVPFGGYYLPPVVPPFTTRVWLLCDGSMVSKTDYPRLWAALGQTYGAAVPPTGNTGTFKLPDTRGRALAGADTSPGTGPQGWVGTGVAGRLTATGLGMAAINQGSAGGAQTHTASINVSGATVSVSGGKINGYVDVDSGTHRHHLVGTANANTSLTAYVTDNSEDTNVSQSGHTHGVDIALGTVDGNNNLTLVGGNIAAEDPAVGSIINNTVAVKTSTPFATVQPTFIVRYIIKT
jgi:microcystin-dependent protein